MICCGDCQEYVEHDDLRECMACGSVVCHWCMDGPVCLGCSDLQED